MAKLIPVFFLLLLSGCGQDLHFKISYDAINGLAEGDAVVQDNRPIGKVTGLEKGPSGGNLVEVAIPRESALAATHEASFILAPDPANPSHSRIEVVPARPGGQPIADGEVVKGTYPSPLGLFPFGELLRGFGDALRDLRGQVEQFRQGFEKLPNSPEAKRLQEEWAKLTDEIAKAQSGASDTLDKEILPKLEKEMEELRKRMEEMQKAGSNKPKPVQI